MSPDTRFANFKYYCEPNQIMSCTPEFIICPCQSCCFPFGTPKLIGRRFCKNFLFWYKNKPSISSFWRLFTVTARTFLAYHRLSLTLGVGENGLNRRKDQRVSGFPTVAIIVPMKWGNQLITVIGSYFESRYDLFVPEWDYRVRGGSRLHGCPFSTPIDDLPIFRRESAEISRNRSSTHWPCFHRT